MDCARLPGSTPLRKILDVLWGATRGSIAYGITIDVPPCSNPYVLSALALANASHLQQSSMHHCSELPSEGLNVEELVCGRIKMMTALSVSKRGRTLTRRCALCLTWSNSDLKPAGCPSRRRSQCHVTYVVAPRPTWSVLSLQAGDSSRMVVFSAKSTAQEWPAGVGVYPPFRNVPSSSQVATSTVTPITIAAMMPEAQGASAGTSPKRDSQGWGSSSTTTTITAASVFPRRGCLPVHKLLRLRTIECRRPRQ